MRFVINPDFFLVKIAKSEQVKRREKQGSLYIVVDEKDESRNTQAGEIVTIGKRAAEVFPQAKVGDTLLLHWMVESKQKNNCHWEDTEHKYYLATALESHGRPCEAYGILRDGEIIPNPEYIFLSTLSESSDMDLKSLSQETGIIVNRPVTTTKSGIIVFKEWKETRTDKEQKMKVIQAEIDSLTKTKMSPQLAVAIQRKEEELAIISNEINKQCILFYRAAALNPDFNEEVYQSMGHYIHPGEKVGMLNSACQTTIEVNGIEYIVALAKHFHCTEKWVKSSITAFKESIAC